LLVAGYWLLVTGCWLLVAGCWLLVAGCWLLVTGCWLLVAGTAWQKQVKKALIKLWEVSYMKIFTNVMTPLAK
jgi:hypothetical protein